MLRSWRHSQSGVRSCQDIISAKSETFAEQKIAVGRFRIYVLRSGRHSQSWRLELGLGRFEFVVSGYMCCEVGDIRRAEVGTLEIELKSFEQRHNNLISLLKTSKVIVCNH